MAPSLLDRLPIIGAVRRNHALEHATLQVLAEKYRGVRMAGISGPQGFLLLADLPTEIVTDGALEAEKRLRAGESSLAVHPHCGTNLAVPLALAGLVGQTMLWASSAGRKPRLLNYILAGLAAVPAFILARPLGPVVQAKLTTSAEQGTSSVRRVVSQRLHETYLHQISTGV